MLELSEECADVGDDSKHKTKSSSRFDEMEASEYRLLLKNIFLSTQCSTQYIQYNIIKYRCCIVVYFTHSYRFSQSPYLEYCLDTYNKLIWFTVADTVWCCVFTRINITRSEQIINAFEKKGKMATVENITMETTEINKTERPA